MAAWSVFHRALADRCAALRRAPAPDRALALAGGLVVLIALAYVAYFLRLQTPGLRHPYVLEWDIRAAAMQVWRYHGSGLFQNDLPTEIDVKLCPLGWRALYWLGTLWTDPHTLSKFLPFALFAAMLWQGFQFGREHGGVVLGALVIALLCHCLFLWDRIVGATPRAFGLPLVVALLRYASAGRVGPSIATVALTALFYPPAFVFSGPAYGLVLLVQRRFRPLLVLIGVGLAAVLLLAPAALRGDPRLGHLTSVEELATFRQRERSGCYPRPPLRPALTLAVKTSLYATWGRRPPPPPSPPAGASPRAPLRENGTACLIVVALLVAAAGARLRQVPLIFPMLLVCSTGAFLVAQAVACRLYIPDRMLLFSWVPAAQLLLPWLAHQAMTRIGLPRPALFAALLWGGVQFGFYGNALVPFYGLHDFSLGVTRIVQFAGTLPKDSLIATSHTESSHIQTFAHRRTLFSSITNVPRFYEYGREMERRIEAYYRAYYATDLQPLRDLRDRYGVTHFIVEEADFRGFDRVYKETTIWRSLIDELKLAARGRFVLAHPPADAIVFRDGTQVVLDLRRL